MKCPFCAHTENKVIDSRLSKDGNVIRRRRECNDCGKRFTTYERIEEIMPQVVLSDGRREPFDHDKLLRGVREACEKRPVPAARIDTLVEEIEKQLQDTGEKEVESSVIAEEVLIRLSEIDDIAYIRYAARFKSYGDLGEIAGELNAMLGERERRQKASGRGS
ncbi:MAG: transcriptional repressor NrdR [Deltaproteobacteria bacterium]|nr:transcriptional repressor NrdR [Deltaproteobacteria bacterium]